MTNYTKGVKLERDIIHLFKENGWNAARTAGSHSPFDVIVWKTTEENKKICFVAFVQCKVTKDLNLNPEKLLSAYSEPSQE